MKIINKINLIVTIEWYVVLEVKSHKFVYMIFKINSFKFYQKCFSLYTIVLIHFRHIFLPSYRMPKTHKDFQFYQNFRQILQFFGNYTT